MFIKVIEPSQPLDLKDAFCPLALQSPLHPTMMQYLTMANDEMVQVYSRNHIGVDSSALTAILSNPAKHFQWGGIDVVPCTNQFGQDQMVVLEANACPTGNSMQTLFECDYCKVSCTTNISSDFGGYTRGG